MGRMMDYIMASAAYPDSSGRKSTAKVPGRRVGGQRAGAYAALRQKDNVIVVNIGDTNLVHDLDPHLNLIYIRPLDPLGRAFAFQPETAQRKIDMGWYDTMKAFGRFSGHVDVLPQRRISAAAG